MSLIFGINSWALTPKLDMTNAVGLIEKLAELPIPGDRRILEYLVFDTDSQASDARFIRDVAADNGFSSVSVCGFNPGDPTVEEPQFSISPYKDARKAALETGYKFIDIAADVTPKDGESRLCGPFYRRHQDLKPVGFDEYEYLVEFLVKLAERAYEKGVELDPEFLNRFELSGPNNTRQLVRLVQDVKEKAKTMRPFPLRGQYDIFHSFIEGEKPTEAIRYAAENDCLGTVHLGDSNRLALNTGAFKGKIGKVLHAIYEATKDEPDAVPVVPEIMCDEFRGNVAIWQWPTDVQIDAPYKQAQDSFAVLAKHVKEYQKRDVYLL